MVFRASWNCEENISEGVRMSQEPDPPAGVRKALRFRWKPPEERPAEGVGSTPTRKTAQVRRGMSLARKAKAVEQISDAPQNHPS